MPKRHEPVPLEGKTSWSTARPAVSGTSSSRSPSGRVPASSPSPPGGTRASWRSSGRTSSSTIARSVPEDIVRDVDLVVDTVGGPSTARFLRTLKRGAASFPSFRLGFSDWDAADALGVTVSATQVRSSGAQLAEVGRLLTRTERSASRSTALSRLPKRAAPMSGAAQGSIQGKIVLTVSLRGASMTDASKLRQGTIPWFQMVGVLMCEAAAEAGLAPDLTISLVERYSDGEALPGGLVQGLRFDVVEGQPRFFGSALIRRNGPTSRSREQGRCPRVEPASRERPALSRGRAPPPRQRGHVGSTATSPVWAPGWPPSTTRSSTEPREAWSHRSAGGHLPQCRPWRASHWASFELGLFESGSVDELAQERDAKARVRRLKISSA